MPAPLVRSVSGASRSSGKSLRSRAGSGQQALRVVSQTRPLSRQRSASSRDSSPATRNDGSPSSRSTSTRHGHTEQQNSTSAPAFDQSLADVSHAIASQVAQSISQTGVADEAQMQMIVQTSLRNIVGSQTIRQGTREAQPTNQVFGRKGPLRCDQCPRTLSRQCDLKYFYPLEQRLGLPWELSELQEAQEAAFETLRLHLLQMFQGVW